LKLLPGSILPSFTLNEPAAIDITPVLSSSTFGSYNIDCNGGTGSIGITVTGGSGVYTYNWTTTGGSGLNATAEDQGALTAGSYVLEVTDFYGCKATFDTVLIEPAALTSALNPKHITCAAPGLNNGEIDLTVAGGVAPYSFLWSNSATSEDITGLTAGEYIVTIIDANACQKKDSVVVNLPPPLLFDYMLSNHNGNGFNISCFNGNDGSINITTNSGVAPFAFTWTGPSGFTSASDNISGLRAGAYNLHIIDSNFCTVDTIFNLNEPGELSLTFDPSHSFAGGYNINCAGDSTGSLNVIPVNAVGTVEYLWSDGNTSQLRDNIPAGKYRVIITDSNFCIAQDSITLTQPDSLKLEFSLTQPWCPDKPDGEIRLTASGGVVGTDYNYKWSDNSTSRDLTDVRSGLYTVKVSDLNGCSIKDSVKMEPQREICLIIPNAISPNGDNINDIWNIGEIDLYPNVEIKIFDRWGILIWKSENGYPQKWDGRSSRGTKMPMESYHYIIDLHNGTKPLIGNITIVR
jgi:gliding motility-associated-like protein